jgi:hypothetical protein
MAGRDVVAGRLSECTTRVRRGQLYRPWRRVAVARLFPGGCDGPLRYQPGSQVHRDVAGAADCTTGLQRLGYKGVAAEAWLLNRGHRDGDAEA